MALAVWLCQSETIWPAFVLAAVLPVIEFLLAMVAFRAGDVRRSGRFAILAWLMPIALLFSMPLLGVAAWGFRVSRESIAAEPFDPVNSSLSADNRIVELTGDLVLRTDLTGTFWAPNDTSRLRRMTPVVDADWCSESPVRIWIESMERDDDRFAGEPLKLVQRSSSSDAIRRREAMRDAEARYGLTTAPEAIVLERMLNPERRSSESGGFLMFGLLINVTAWCMSAVCWPKPAATATLS